MTRLHITLVVFCTAMLCASSVPAGMAPKRSVLSNGLVLLTSEQRALPMVSIELLIDAGSRYDGAKQEGLANLTTKLLRYGTKQRTALQINETSIFSAPVSRRAAARTSPVSA